MPTSYSEKLKDPRWQRKRLGILNRDDFRCLKCSDETTTLHVHHKTYEWGKDPWDYPDDNFETLCEQCHSAHHNGDEKREPLAIYLAGKIKKECWRHLVVDGLRNAVGGECGSGDPCDEFPLLLQASIFNEHHYAGPFFLSCDHGCFHGKGTHGAVLGPDYKMSASETWYSRNKAFYRCLSGIRRSDMVFAWVDSKDCYGTLVELGYARALQKHVRVFFSPKVKLDDLWFSLMTSDIAASPAECPKEALKLAIEDCYKYNASMV